MIYIHIPFCKQKCSYCNFHFSTSLQFKEELLGALKKEIGLRHQELPERTLQSLYLGGGTPSLLLIDELQAIFEEIQRYFNFAEDIEVTLEANPDDLTSEYLRALSRTPVNRLSIGTQSFFEEELRFMNRAHDAGQAKTSILQAQDFGFKNISVDLIYGSPLSTPLMWQQNLETLLELNVPHISSYALTVEPRTALEAWVKTGKAGAPKDSAQNAAFFYMSSFLKEHGFEHYEISNFAKSGFRSRHNSAYWNYAPYLGLGPSAHSYDGVSARSWNIAHNKKYIGLITAGQTPFECEVLSEREQFNEMLMLGLRTAEGVNLQRLQEKFSAEILAYLDRNVQPKIEVGLLEKNETHLCIPEKHWFLADGIAADLFSI